MCDLFALSAAKNYSAPKSLPLFAYKAGKNMDGWGIGFFRKNRAYVEKSADRVYHAGRYADGFQRLARVVASKLIIAHVRLRTSGPIDECHAHPFILHFLGEDWIFAHNGKAHAIESYTGKTVHIESTVSDSARTFEYLLDGIAAQNEENGSVLAFYMALAKTTQQLVEEYPGNYNYLLTNGWVLFAFTNHRQFFLLKGSQSLENALLLTTVNQGLSPENWVRVARQNLSRGLLLAIVGNDIVLQEDL